MNILAIIVAGILSNNFLLVKTMGICPFLGVSKKTDSALGMGIAVTFVMVLTCLVCYPLYMWLLVPNGLEYLEIIVFILVIASLVQILEMILKKFIPGLYSAMGIYLPLITTNCAILGVAELVTVSAGTYAIGSYLDALIYGLASGIGFTLVMLIMSGLRERVDRYNLAKPLKGFPIVLIVAGFMAMAFSMFAGISFGA